MSASAQQAASAYPAKITTKAPLADSLRVCVIGGGIGGTATALSLANRGFTVDVYEQAPRFGEVGAGINLGPNFTRVLARLGVLEASHGSAVPIAKTETRRGATNEVLADVDFAYMAERYGSGPYVAHRKDTINALLTGCAESNRVNFRLGEHISELDFEGVRLKRKDGSWAEYDVILAADGVKSKTRAAMLERSGGQDDIRDTTQAAFRILLKREQMEHDPELLELIDTPRVTRWTGPKRHIIAYPISDKQIYNISTAHPDSRFPPGDSTSWTTSGSLAAVLDEYRDFCPLVQKYLSLAPQGEILELHAPLKTWVDGRVALIGDACHPTLPHLAQGAAQAAEDADALGAIFGKIDSVEQIPAALKVYELVRKARAEAIVEGASASGRTLHLSDESAADRDAAFAKLKTDPTSANPDRWASRETQDILFGVDCVQQIEEQWPQLLEQARQLV